MTNEEAIADLETLLAYIPIYRRFYQSISMGIKALKQEPKTGHWEWLTEDKYRCSKCNSETRVDECLNEPMYVFCPFCGAKMFVTGK